MYLKFRPKNTQIELKKRFLCGNNGNSPSLKSEITPNTPHYILLIINSKYPFKNLCVHFILYTTFTRFKCIRCSTHELHHYRF